MRTLVSNPLKIKLSGRVRRVVQISQRKRIGQRDWIRQNLVLDLECVDQGQIQRQRIEGRKDRHESCTKRSLRFH